MKKICAKYYPDLMLLGIVILVGVLLWMGENGY